MSRHVTGREYAGKLQQAGALLTSWARDYSHFDGELLCGGGVKYFRVMFVEGGAFHTACLLTGTNGLPARDGSGLPLSFRSMASLERALGIAS